MRIGLYSPFWGSTVGGGEKYLGAAAAAIRDAWPEHAVSIVSPAETDRDRYERQLGLDLDGITLRGLNRGAGSGGARRRLAGVPALRRLRNLMVAAQAAPVSAEYDLWISMVYVLPASNRARRGVILCQFPYPLPGGRGPRALALKALRRRLFGNEVGDFAEVIVQSEFVRAAVERTWHRQASVVNPPVDVPVAEPDWSAKSKVVLSVGRYFAGGHSKRHDVMARAFRALVDTGDPAIEGWELHLAGSLHQKPADREYFTEVRRLAEGYPIHVHTDLSRPALEDLYRRASIYWHAAGHGVDVGTRPSDVEHFGITTVEAMAAGAVPVAINVGGQPEIVTDGVDGYLWSTLDELQSKTLVLARDAALRRDLALAARARSLEFSAVRFRDRIVGALRPHVEFAESAALLAK